jgi:hypothetical protein
VWIDWDKKRLVILRTASIMNPLTKVIRVSLSVIP